MTNYEWDIRCADVELRRLQDGFTSYDHINFARVLLQGYSRAQADVHIETGSLRASMRADIQKSTRRKWEGEISAGGESTGLKNPVRYAASEYFGTSARYGGPPAHNFYRNVEARIDDDMIGPVSSFISRGRRTPHPEAGGL